MQRMRTFALSALFLASVLAGGGLRAQDDPVDLEPTLVVFERNDTLWARLAWTVVATDSGKVAWYTVNARQAQAQGCVESPFPSCQNRLLLMADSIFFAEIQDSVTWLSVDIALEPFNPNWWIGAEVCPAPRSNAQSLYTFFCGWAPPVQLQPDWRVPPPSVRWDSPPADTVPPPDTIPPPIDPPPGDVQATAHRNVADGFGNLLGTVRSNMAEWPEYVSGFRTYQTSGWVDEQGRIQMTEVGHRAELCAYANRCDCHENGNDECGCNIMGDPNTLEAFVTWSVDSSKIELIYPIDYVPPVHPRTECFDFDGVSIPCGSGYAMEPLGIGWSCLQRAGNPHECDPPPRPPRWTAWGPCVQIRRVG